MSNQSSIDASSQNGNFTARTDERGTLLGRNWSVSSNPTSVSEYGAMEGDTLTTSFGSPLTSKRSPGSADASKSMKTIRTAGKTLFNK